MKINAWVPSLFVFSGLFVSQACFGQPPPPNDNYSNSIVLTGTDLVFSGTLAGATLEDSQETVAENQTYGSGIAPPTRSVWWNWTAPVSTVLNFHFLSSFPQYPQNQALDVLFVYTATNLSTFPDSLVLPALGSKLIGFELAPQSLSIPVTAGTNYQIQLIGSGSATYAIRLVATNSPVIIVQPQSQTVYSNASVLFYVVAAGIDQSSFTYQWCFNGANLSGETAPMLALTNIGGAMAGNYSVAVSNAVGFTMSQPAILSISQSNVPISLAIIGVRSNNFVFSLTGENGRNYRIESSTDLVHWAPELSFPIGPVLPDTTSIVFNANLPLLLSVTNNSSRKFFRAAPYVAKNPAAEVCINNMRQIRIAKLFWQRSVSFQNPIFAPNLSEILPYFPHQTAPICPLDVGPLQSFSTSYEIRNLQQEPFCDIEYTTHNLEDPQ